MDNILIQKNNIHIEGNVSNGFNNLCFCKLFVISGVFLHPFPWLSLTKFYPFLNDFFCNFIKSYFVKS